MQLFFEFLLCALGEKERMNKVPSASEWTILFQMCKEQAVLGVAFIALDKLSKHGQKPPQKILFEWIGLTERIKQQNRIVNRNAALLCQRLKADGFECCILKGQGNTLMYPDPYCRIPGDIDVWIVPMGHAAPDWQDGRKNVIRYVKQQNHKGNACYHHIDYGMFHGTEVEVHYRPSFMFNPVHNRRLQRWFLSHRQEQFRNMVQLPDGVGTVNIPTPAFNAVFQLSHIYNHFLHEGIGLRQVIDYYYLLNTTDAKDSITDNTLRHLGLEKMAGAMMWVLNKVLGLPDQYLIAAKDEKRGRTLLKEITKGGTFGKYDIENQKANNRAKKNIQRVKRDLRMLRLFPSECLWEPIFRTYHLMWRIIYN